MNSTDSLNSQSKNIFKNIVKNWENLDKSQKTFLTKIWRVLTYKWKLQILLNLPFLIWWGLDKSIAEVHELDVNIVSYLNLPEWAVKFIGFGQ